MHDFTSLPPVVPIAEESLTRRQRAHLHWGRVALSLAISPLLGGGIMTLLFYLASSFDSEESRLGWDDLAMMICSPSVWSVFCGMVYLQTITRLRGQIARHECILLGCLCSFLFPTFLFMSISVVLQGGSPRWFDWEDLQYLSIMGLICVPFGLFGGWLFWRLGVRPAATPTQDYAAIFE